MTRTLFVSKQEEPALKTMCGSQSAVPLALRIRAPLRRADWHKDSATGRHSALPLIEVFKERRQAGQLGPRETRMRPIGEVSSLDHLPGLSNLLRAYVGIELFEVQSCGNELVSQDVYASPLGGVVSTSIQDFPLV